MYNKNIGILGVNNGYLYFCDSTHPLADTNTRVYLHRHLMSLYLGRWLKSAEHVHHIDDNKQNNAQENLIVMSNSEHAKQHALEQGKALKATILCPTCKSSFMQKDTIQKYCSISCSSTDQVKDKSISRDVLDQLIPTMSWVAIGKIFGYSDTGIKKRAKALGCDITKSRFKRA